MKIALVIITCPGRETLLKQTVESLTATDFTNPRGPAARIYIQKDETTFERKQERQEHNSLAALKKALDHPNPPDVILFCEDDILFNAHLRHNLEHWMPLTGCVTAITPCCERDRDADGNCDRHPAGRFELRPFFGSLYDPTIRELKMVPEEHYFIADPEAVYGSQCFVMTRPMAEYFVEHWWEVPGMQDIKMSRLAARLAPVHYHLPSLVQHVGFTSVWGGHFHDTKMFDANFKAGI